MKRFGLLLLAFVMCVGLRAQEEMSNDQDFTHNRGGVAGLLTSSDSWQAEFSYHYMFGPLIGIGGSVGAWRVYMEEGWASGKDWEIESDDNKPSNVYLRPSLMLMTPAVRIKSVGVGLFLEPGLMLNLPYREVRIRQDLRWPDYEYRTANTTGGQWFAVDIRTGVFVKIGSGMISAGYMMSDFDVYGQQRHLSYRGQSFKDFYPRKPFMQGAYLSLTGYF